MFTYFFYLKPTFEFADSIRLCYVSFFDEFMMPFPTEILSFHGLFVFFFVFFCYTKLFCKKKHPISKQKYLCMIYFIKRDA